MIEVLVATVILAGGLLGAAAVQLNALKHTDSALMTTQASFIAYDMLDRIRANNLRVIKASIPVFAAMLGTRWRTPPSAYVCLSWNTGLRTGFKASFASTCSAPAETSSPGKATTKVLPRKAWM